MGIGETLCQALAKLLLRASGEQAKTGCGNLQLCAGLKDGIEGATHAVVQRRLERVRRRKQEGEDAEADEEEGETESVGLVFYNLTMEMAGMEEEAAEQLTAALGMEVDGEGEGEE